MDEITGNVLLRRTHKIKTRSAITIVILAMETNERLRHGRLNKEMPLFMSIVNYLLSAEASLEA